MTAPLLYSWGYNSYGQCLLDSTDSNHHHDENDDFALGCLLVPHPVDIPAPAVEAETENESIPTSSSTNHQNDSWVQWETQPKGGGFVFKSSFMVYGNEPSSLCTPSLTPTPTLTTTHIHNASASAFHTAVITSDKTLLMGGWNGHLQLGVQSNNVVDDRCPGLHPVVSLLKQSITSVACGAFHTIASSASGRVWTWGAGKVGQLGYCQIDVDLDANNSNSNSNTKKHTERRSSSFLKTNSKTFCNPTPKPLTDLFNIKSVHACFDSSFALRQSGEVYSWGNNEYGQLGLGANFHAQNNNSVFTPTQTQIDKQILSVAAGDFHVLFLTSQGAVFSCGLTTFGRTGLNPQCTKTESQPTLTVVELFLDDGLHVDKICAGGASSAAIVGNEVYVFGYNTSGNLGLNGTIDVYEPTRINFFKISNISIIDVALGEDHSVFLSDSGMMFCSGKTSCGRLGFSQASCEVEAAAIIGDSIDSSDTNVDGIFAVVEAEIEREQTNDPNQITANVGESFSDSINNAFVNDSPLIETPICIGCLFDDGDGANGGVTSGGAHNLAFKTSTARYTKRTSGALLVDCRFSRHGCRGKLLGALIELHESRCKFRTRSCKFKTFGCREENLIFLSKADFHETECDFRLVRCESCKAEVPLNALGVHEDVCDMILVKCEKCGFEVVRKKFEAHMAAHLEEEKEEEEKVEVEVGVEKEVEVDVDVDTDVEVEEVNDKKPKPKPPKPKPKRVGGGFAR